MTIPPQGTKEFDAFLMRAAENPASQEALLLDAAVGEAKVQYQRRIRSMLDDMINLVPGQVFRDVSLFHEKYRLEPTDDPGHRLPKDMLEFRLKFMLEELCEYAEAIGANMYSNKIAAEFTVNRFSAFDPDKALDAICDLVYVAVGTACLHRFNFNEAWARVQEKNMQKVRVESPDQSKRKSKYDVVKPEGWTPPDHSDLMGFACSSCGKRSTKLQKGDQCDVVHPSEQRCLGKMG